MERMTEAEKLKQRMSRDNPYNSFSSDNFLNANTGKEVRMVTERWEYKHYVDKPNRTIDNEIEELVYNLPQVIDLSTINKDKIEFDYDDWYSKGSITKEDLKSTPLGFIKCIVNNIDENLVSRGTKPVEYDSEEDRIWFEYINKLPKFLILEELTDEQFGFDDSLIMKFKNERTHLNHELANLPEETLKFLLEKYK